jgi:signal transduction histidine kinase
VREAVSQAEPLAHANGHTLTLETPPGTVPIVADGERLLQVMANLLDNAIKFTPDRGTIAVRLERGPTTTRVTVRNTGPGIPAEQLPRVFDAYWRGNVGREGKGLGLAIAKLIVEAHGGEMSAQSSDLGTEFSFTLPQHR